VFISQENPAELYGSSEVPVVLVIINEMLEDFLGFIRYVPFPIFTSSLTKNRTTNTKGNGRKNYTICLIHIFQIVTKMRTFIYNTDK
jgi:hypothetical protein